MVRYASYYTDYHYQKINIDGVEIAVGPCTSIPYNYYTISLNGALKDIVVNIDDYSIEPLDRLKNAVKLAYALIKEKYPVAICCSGGCGRTGTATILLLMAYFNKPLEEALKIFMDARNCGPESLNQKLLLAYAELLRRNGLRGDALIDSLTVLTKPIKFDKYVFIDDEYFVIDGVKIRSSIAMMIKEKIVEMLKNAKTAEIPITVDCELLEEIGMPEDVRKLVRDMKKLKEIWDEAELKVSTSRTSRVSKKSRRKNIVSYEDYWAF